MTYEVDNSKFYVKNPMTNDSVKPSGYEENPKERLEQESLTLKEEAEKRKKLEQELLTLKEGEVKKKKKLEQELLTLKKESYIDNVYHW
ncbi:MAG: hypothetical protein ABS808_03850 [Wolbachia endosymbiont of Polyergus mexicanus]|uniref:Transposase n=1 Tax=Wolbachia endosymbiont of Polyergus mexicanus TaxID=3171167 RepID=A0AAU7YGB8_9RICK